MTAELLEIARRIALEAGTLAARRRHEGVSVAATKSSEVDVVTAADRETEQLIRSLIAAERPHDAFYGEESDATSGASGIVWVVDPIDGTVNYLYGSPAWAVSIAVGELKAPDAAAATSTDPTDGWRPLAGVVYAPSSAELFFASAGGGAWLQRVDGASPQALRSEPERLRVNSAPSLAQSLVGTGFSYSADRRAAQGAVLHHLLPRVRDIRRAGSAALDLCSVACGRLDAYFERHLNPWDYAAGALIAREAGAHVAGLRGASESAEMLIAAESSLWEWLHSALAEAEAEAEAEAVATVAVEVPAQAGPRLETERLILRRWTEAERAPFAAINADPRVMEHFPAVLDAAASDALIDRIEAGFERDGFGLWAVERRDTGEFIGFVGLAKPRFTAHFTSEEQPAVEVGWRLAPDAWGHGFASEAARAVLRFGFEHLGLREIVSFTARQNERSQAVMRRIGMTHLPSDDFAHPSIDPQSPLSEHVLFRIQSH